MIGIIGAGNMGSALAQAFADKGVVVCDCNQEKLAQFADEQTTRSVAELGSHVKIVLVAVKPNSFVEMARELKGDWLLISVMAGVTLKELKEKTGKDRVVRAMPNLGVQVGKGATGWVASPEVSEEERREVAELFSLCGVEVEVEDEEMIDAVTAVSGSGPAYFFYLCALLQEKGQALGLTEQQARLLAEQTCIGAGELLKKGSETAAEWKKAVTSKGGTTEAAFEVLEAEGFKDLFFAGIDAATHRAKELKA